MVIMRVKTIRHEYLSSTQWPHFMNNDDISNEFNALREFSARVGNDPLQVQAAGGNTSIKNDGILWIKASGTWLANAVDSELFVPVSLQPLLEARERDDPNAEKATDFVCQELNPSGLRPSIETTVHAVIPQRVVVHVHCVDTIALAIRSDAQALLGDVLCDFNWLWVPYCQPGLPLSHFISAHLQPEVDVVVLGNHGLVVAADSVAEAESLLDRVRSAVAQKPLSSHEADTSGLQELCAETTYAPSTCRHTHAIAMNRYAVAVAEGGSLYPDHVIFLGEGTTVMHEESSLTALTEKTQQQRGKLPVSIVVPNLGVVMHRNANASQHALARCLSDVCLRVPADATINYLNAQENHQLLNWEAEVYRQSIAQ